MTKNDKAWEQVFQELDVLEMIHRQGFFFISSKELIKFREPRLMAKLDTKESRPKIFKDNDLVIWPIKNGKFIIFPDREHKSYYSFGEAFESSLIETYLPQAIVNEIQTLQLSNITSEAQAIDYAFLTSLLKTYTGEREIHLTRRGRYFSRDFRFTLTATGLDIPVSGVQIELDAGYEGENRIYIVEAKMGTRKDFHIRQLYYPYCDLLGTTTKEIIPLFIAYSNGIFYFAKLRFGPNFGDIDVLETRRFVIGESPKIPIDFKRIIASITMEASEPAVPYPQANDLNKVIDLITQYPVICSQEDPEVTHKEAITRYFEFDERQADYYANAALYLGYLRRDDDRAGKFLLTDLGISLSNWKTRAERNRSLLTQLSKKPTFHEILITLAKHAFHLNEISLNDIAEIIQQYSECNKITALRRASTVRAWLKWILETFEFH